MEKNSQQLESFLVVTENVEGTSINDNVTMVVQSNQTADINTSLYNTNDQEFLPCYIKVIILSYQNLVQ